MIKNREIIMCQDDVAQLCSQAKVAKQLAGPSVAGGGLGHRLHRHLTVSFSSWARIAEGREADLRNLLCGV